MCQKHSKDLELMQLPASNYGLSLMTVLYGSEVNIDRSKVFSLLDETRGGKAVKLGLFLRLLDGLQNGEEL